MRRYRIEIRGREFVIDVDDVAADRFDVVVGGETYEVVLTGDEDLREAKITPAFAPARVAGTPAAAPTDADASRPGRKPVVGTTPAARAVPLARKPAAGGTGTLSAPMPGVILEVSVVAGDVVTRGQPIAILDAMKMQNNLRSPRAGTIAEVCVAAGQAVGHGDAIVRFEEG
jgi:biotin carboxyl carrier protein